MGLSPVWTSVSNAAKNLIVQQTLCLCHYVQKLRLHMPMQASICALLNSICCYWAYPLLALCTHRVGYRVAELIRHLPQLQHLLLLAQCLHRHGPAQVVQCPAAATGSCKVECSTVMNLTGVLRSWGHDQTH